MIPTLLTVVAAGLLGGAIAADITAIGVVAAVALVLIGLILLLSVVARFATRSKVLEEK